MKNVILTIGPSFLHNDILKNNHNPNNIYRINASHCNQRNIISHTETIRKQVPDAKILLDLPGNKIRTANILEPIQVFKGQSFYLDFDQFNFSNFFKYVKVGDIVWADDSTLKFVIEELLENSMKLNSFQNGQLRNNKGFHVRGVNAKLPHLFEKDIALLGLAQEIELDYVGLSFIRNAEDVINCKNKLSGPEVIVKIETQLALDNIDEILQTADLFLLDRGDLSTEVGLVYLAHHQSFILNKIKEHNKKIILATQMLKNMEHHSIPSIAESIDMVNSLKLGINGIQLSEETAVGANPLACIAFINDVCEMLKKTTDLPISYI